MDGFLKLCDVNRGIFTHNFSHRTNEVKSIFNERKFVSDSFGVHSNHNMMNKDDFYIQELERISSNLIQVLSATRQRAIQMREPSGISQRLFDDRYKNFVSPEGSRFICGDKQYNSDNYNLNIVEESAPQQKDEQMKRTPVITNNNLHDETGYLRCHSVFEKNEKRFAKLIRNAKNTNSLEQSAIQKKAAHNKVEKKRRNFISTRITELRDLLPDHIDRESCKRKGVILKETIDYIKYLRQNQDGIKKLRDQISETEIKMKVLVEKLEKLEAKLPDKSTKRDETNREQDFQGGHSMHYASQEESMSKQKILSNLYSSHSDVPIILPVVPDMDTLWVDLSSTIAADSTTSYPITNQADNGGLDC